MKKRTLGKNLESKKVRPAEGGPEAPTGRPRRPSSRGGRPANSGRWPLTTSLRCSLPPSSPGALVTSPTPEFEGGSWGDETAAAPIRRADCGAQAYRSAAGRRASAQHRRMRFQPLREATASMTVAR